VVPGHKLFGSRSVWRGQVRVPISDPHKTVVDVLDDPSVGGGLRHVADVVVAYFTADVRDDAVLLAYVERLGNRTVYKRLEYLIEALDLAAPEVARACRKRQSTGISLLDPDLPAQGRIRRRWNLRINAAVAPLDQAG
jgi:predicted transcriptional regulator of viral defense system